MSSPEDIVMGEEREEGSQPQEPFTLEENIQQLNAIDKSTVQLMSHTATALGALTTPASSDDSNPSASVESAAQKEAFRQATDTFLSTLHSIDVRMKRQILALEEAGIVNLSSGPRQGHNPGIKPSLKPNGVGAIGNLDVGWLNSRGTKVERDMELELWKRARELLEKDGKNIKKE
ncbi:mediator complex, subunit med11 [Trichoderma arundinaceum]|uniref:Mediator of RNA polymerase II transcription subunit 11 n=1 Tax=Trichoderma arundinaceum TaxID=490622 RepID=A0A395NYV9_TRIAR|nr:mediator complex, subunit med11 [Trichoderma arundinaceum]